MSHPRLRPNLKFVEQTQAGVTVHIVKDPVNLKYFKFGAREVGLMQLMNGSRSLSEIADAAHEALGLKTTAGAVERFAHRLKEMGLVERTPEERSALLMEFVRQSRAARTRGHGRTLWRMRFSLGDPDVLLSRMDRVLGRTIFSAGFVALSIGLFALYGIIVGTHWQSFSYGINMLYSPQSYTLSFALMLYLTTAAIFMVHEFGHGLTCKHYGGEVHEMGVMLIYFTPAFYCNVNDAWTFEHRAQRLWVTFAGGWIQLVLAAFAAIVWIATQPETTLHTIAFIALLIGGGMTVLINFNPLIPLDGYYALLDWVGIPNLRARSFEYLRAFIKRKVFRADVPLPTATPREARIFVIYGALSRLYIIMLLSFLGLAIGKFLGNHWGGWGLALFGWLVWRMTRQPRHRLARKWEEFDVRQLKQRLSPHLQPRRVAAAAAILLLPFVLPWTIRVSGTALVESPERLFFRAAEDARVESIAVKEGDEVAAGAVLAVLRNPQLELEWTRTRAAVQSLERLINVATTSGDYASQRAAELELLARREMMARLDARRDALVLRAPASGRIVTAHSEELVGATLEAGDSLLEMQRAGLQARVLLAERDAGDLDRGDIARLKFPVHAAATWHSRIAEVGSAARAGQLELVVPLTRNNTTVLRPGMAGVAKIRARRTTLAGAMLRNVRRTIRTDLWL